MDISLATPVRSSRMAAIVSAIDGGGGPGRLLIYQGTRPASGGLADPEDLLGDIALPVPCATVTDGVLTFAAPEDAHAVAHGAPSWGRYADAAGTYVLDGSFGEGELFSCDTAEVYTGGVLSVSTSTLTDGNP